jgi:hypothetical protein
MIAPVRRQQIRIDPLAVFIARAEARALLWHCLEFDLHSAVDELWAAAVRDGLVAKLGTDEVQRLLADAFAPVRDDLVSASWATDLWSGAGWREAAIDYHKKRGRRISLLE